MVEGRGSGEEGVVGLGACHRSCMVLLVPRCCLHVVVLVPRCRSRALVLGTHSCSCAVVVGPHLLAILHHAPLIPAGMDPFHWNLQEWAGIHRNGQEWTGMD